MKAWNLQKTLQVSLCLIALAGLIGCGKSKSSDDGFGTTNNSSNVTNSSTDALALCSQDMSDNADLKVRVMQYVDQYGQARPDYVRVQFLKVPSNWSTTNLDMNVRRWAVSPDNKSSMDTTSLSYQFERKVSAGFQLLTDYSYQVFNYSEVKQMAAFAGIAETSFFNQASILVNLKGDSSSFQALRIQFTGADSSGTIASYVDVLIPTFQADPAKYDADPRHPYTLQVLHPLKDKLGQAWTQAQYYDFTRSFCF
jgi:hypothetical protein